jgi:hypothetical protein
MKSKKCLILITETVYKPFEPYIQKGIFFSLKDTLEETALPVGYVSTPDHYSATEVWVANLGIKLNQIVHENNLTKKFLVKISVKYEPVLGDTP